MLASTSSASGWGLASSTRCQSLSKATAQIHARFDKLSERLGLASSSRRLSLSKATAQLHTRFDKLSERLGISIIHSLPELVEGHRAGPCSLRQAQRAAGY
jgi:hypothetical protein